MKIVWNKFEKVNSTNGKSTFVSDWDSDYS